jgi:hypothetical protein
MGTSVRETLAQPGANPRRLLRRTFRAKPIRIAVIGSKKVAPEAGGPAGAAHSTRASAQVTAPGAITSMMTQQTE